ncbi:Phospholipase/Carboxylesterase-domain-containing protein [Zopfochytrium polystomum]|nr:Phospholipase/Carboxylesterase-domain-containing protein [Zopfochytrium polystomum]
MASPSLAPLIIQTATKQGQRHTATVFFLHGLGDSARGWAPFAAIAPALPHVRFVLPTAPAIPVGINEGAVMPAWFDIHAFGKYDEQGVLDSMAACSGERLRDVRHRRLGREGLL